MNNAEMNKAGERMQTLIHIDSTTNLIQHHKPNVSEYLYYYKTY